MMRVYHSAFGESRILHSRPWLVQSQGGNLFVHGLRGSDGTLRFNTEKSGLSVCSAYRKAVFAKRLCYSHTAG